MIKITKEQILELEKKDLKSSEIPEKLNCHSTTYYKLRKKFNLPKRKKADARYEEVKSILEDILKEKLDLISKKDEINKKLKEFTNPNITKRIVKKTGLITYKVTNIIKKYKNG